ncbi:MAG: PEP/pyruvate-binding domain-containing protein [Candidatus Zixiibacteriota bacterium]
MIPDDQSIDKLLQSLQERAKELNCIYKIDEILNDFNASISEICYRIINEIPPGWQFPDICQSEIIIEGQSYHDEKFQLTEWKQSSKIIANNIIIGEISVYYTEDMPPADVGPFLKEEVKLINTIAERIGQYYAHRKMREIIGNWESLQKIGDVSTKQWQIVLQMLKQSDRNLYVSIARKMLNYLCWIGIAEAEEVFKKYSPKDIIEGSKIPDTWNEPLNKISQDMPVGFDQTVFEIASKNISDDDIFALAQKWIQEDKLSFLVQVVNRNLSLAEVADAIRRYYHLAEEEKGIKSPNERGIQVSLIRRFLSDQLGYINVIKNFIEISDFYHLLQNVIFSAESHGRLGGKSAGLYMASQIIKAEKEKNDILKNVRIPKTWHITSDVLLHFMHYNNFEEVVEQKYKEINQVRLEYPHIVETFKRAPFPPDIARGLAMALDDFGDVPLIVRSSSLLEDRVGASFSGKYKSLFLANRGTKHERLDKLMDAIAEVYASTFAPDPIEYRIERSLVDFGEEMGIIIQEVVGKKMGHYYLPAFAGVAFSRNEFRWSPRIKREDGLVRLVPGLGTRAVDRLSDDYPTLIAPGQPGLRVNLQPDEIFKYSSRYIDAINLETGKFETIEVKKLLAEVGDQYPMLSKIISSYKDGHISRTTAFELDFNKDSFIVDFEGLFKNTPFIQQISTILKVLEDIYGYPVDIEFAHDGDNFYLLQCRSQSSSEVSQPAPIPKDIPEKDILFSANKYISNGYVPDISHIVYVDPDKYNNLSSREDMLTIGRIVGKLNKLLPKRQFILMGPGRWGSRGDISLGVSATYSDINNTAVLIEIARKKGNYIPDLSFGTHFFQDLVESQIKYLPLYPDDEGNIFNDTFFNKCNNLLSQILPEYESFSEVVKLIDVKQCANGRILNVLLNADLEEAIGLLADSSQSFLQVTPSRDSAAPEVKKDFWQWRYKMVERLAVDIDPQKYGVVALYIFGSTKNATAGPGSDIDLLVHFRGSASQLDLLNNWLTGWSQCLAEFNYMRTGYRTEGLLDIHIITDDDIEKKTSYASKIGAVTDPAREVPMGKKSK